MIGKLLRLILILLVVLLALLIYRLASPPKAEQPSRPAGSLGQGLPDMTAIDAQVKAMQAQAQVAMEGAQALARRLDAEQHARAVFISEFAMTTALKVAMSECYLSNGAWPMDGCGIDPDDLRGNLLERVSIEAGGAYLLHFTAGLGLPEITVRMQGEANSVGVRWHCSSPDYPGIARLLPDCDYRENFRGISP